MAVKTIIKTFFCAQIRITCIVLTSPEKPQHFDSLIDKICRISTSYIIRCRCVNIVHILPTPAPFLHWHSRLRRGRFIMIHVN